MLHKYQPHQCIRDGRQYQNSLGVGGQSSYAKAYTLANRQEASHSTLK